MEATVNLQKLSRISHYFELVTPLTTRGYIDKYTSFEYGTFYLFILTTTFRQSHLSENGESKTVGCI